MFRRVYALCRNLLRKERVNRELDDELRSYLELLPAENIRRGMTREQAYLEARREAGSFEQVKESVRDIRSGISVDALLQDSRYALRALLKNPAFSIVAILTLALGIGANTTMFTVVNSVILKPLPYPEPQRLLMLFERQLTDGSLQTVAPANFVDWRHQTHSFEKMAAIDPYPDFILSGSGEPRRLAGAAVSADFFSLLGVHVALGRGFLAQEDSPGQNHVVILSYSIWTTQFGARPDIVGRQQRLNGDDYTVVGVLPRDFSFRASDFQSRTRFDVWTPLALPAIPPAWLRGNY